jgi:hypothetical protein
MLIAKALSHGNHNLSPISRAMLLSDASEFFMRNILDVRIYLELLSHLRKSVGGVWPFVYISMESSL